MEKPAKDKTNLHRFQALWHRFHLYSFRNNRLRPFFSAALILSLLLSSGSWAQSTLTLWNRNFDTAPVDQFLQLALDKTTDLYPPSYIIRSEPMEQNEALHSLLQQQGLNIMSVATSAQWDQQFITLRFPILKGLLGYRVCLMRKNDALRFKDLRTAFDFKQQNVKVCQGSDWPDMNILTANGIPVVGSTQYSALFTMLQEGQCDCFLRGSQEIVPEYQKFAETLEIESSIMVRYIQPGVVYVHKSKPELATRLELGLLRALEDGSYDALLHRLLSDQLKQLNLSGRREIFLNHPDPSPELEAFDDIRALEYQP